MAKNLIGCGSTLLFVQVFAAQASRAAGLSGGLEALRALAIAALVFFTFGFLIFLGVVFAIAKARSKRNALDGGLAVVPIPLGLRLLAAVQILLAFLYGAAGFLRFLVPAEYENGHVAPWLMQAIAFRAAFSILAVLSALSYLNRSSWNGFRLGSWLGWLCVANFVLVALLHGPYWIVGLDPFSLFFGLALLALLNFQYRTYFGLGVSGREGSSSSPPTSVDSPGYDS